ncbi:MAG: hypothetical protein JNM79_03800 [Burkholderiales bacterium]|nr:hypothetical protein [Burkholderiales bacterium]
MRIRLTNANNAAFLGVTLGFAAIAAALVLGWYGQWREPDCQSLPVQSVAAAAGDVRAVQEQEACASTDRLATRVTVSGGRFGPGGTVFATESGDALGAMWTGQRTLPLKLVWESDAALAIFHPAHVAPIAQPPLAGLSVRLVAVPP